MAVTTVREALGFLINEVSNGYCVHIERNRRRGGELVDCFPGSAPNGTDIIAYLLSVLLTLMSANARLL